MENKDEKPAEGAPAQSDEEINSLDSISEGKDGASAAASGETPGGEAPKPKKSFIKRVFGFFNVYLLIFLFLLVVGGAVFIVYYLNSKKTPPVPTIATSTLSPSSISQIANGGQATIGDAKTVLNVQSSAVFAGQILARGDVNIAGNLKLGNDLSVPNLTVSGTSNLGTAQVNQLQVANSMTVQGTLTITKDVNVAGATTLNNVTASKISVGNLTLGGTLQLNSHISTGGANPGRSVGGAVGSGGSASVSGSDLAGVVHINTGSNTGSGCFITVNFIQKYAKAPVVNLTPITAGGAVTNYYVTSSTSSFSVCAATPAPTGTQVDFNYFVIE